MATNIASLYAKISADTTDFESGMRKTDSMLGKVGGAFATFAKVAVAAATGAIVGFTAVITKSVLAAADMEQSLANIQAAMNLTSEETAKLKQLIEDLGLDPKLMVSATEAAAAIEMLGKNGLTVDQILQGAARSTILLANATGGDFALAADVATSTMQAFGIDASNMNSVVSSISGALVQSKFDMNDYALALAQGGGVAAAVGVPFEDFNTTIAAISPLFGSGSDAGTSFKTMLQRLVPQSDDAADMMQELGLLTGMTGDQFTAAEEKMDKMHAQIAALDPTSADYATTLAGLQNEIARVMSTMSEGQSVFFTADGQLRGMDEIAGSLAQSLNGLSDEQKNQALSTIFGTDAMRAAVALAMVGQKEFLRLKGIIGQTDAEQQAATRMDTLKGKIEILRGVIEAISIRIGDKFIPAVKQIADWVLELTNKYQPQIDAFFEALAGRVTDTVAAFIENWPMISKAVAEVWKVLQELLPKGQAIFSKFASWFTSTEGKRPMEWFVRFVAGGMGFVAGAWNIVTSTVDAFELLGQAFEALKRLDFGEVANLSRRAATTLFGGGFDPVEMEKYIDDIMKRVYGKANGGWASGMTLVGERGPELVDLPNGSYVHSNSESAEMMRSGTSINIQNLNLSGTGAAGADLRNTVTFLNAMYSYGY